MQNKFKKFPMLSAFVLIIVAVALVLGCQKPPTQEKNDAESAEKAAVTANAEKLAPDEYKAAVDEKQNAENAMLTKDYEKSKSSFVAAKEKFIAAKDAATKKVEEIKGELDSLSQKATELKGTVSELVESASSSCIDDAFKGVVSKIKDKKKVKEVKAKADEAKKSLKADFDKNLTASKDNLVKVDALVQEASGLTGDETVLDKKEKLDNAVKMLEDTKTSLEAPCNNAKSEAEKLIAE